MKHTAKSVGNIIKVTRESLGITQHDLAMTCGTGRRFIIDLEHGKDTSQLGKTLTVINTLGIKIELIAPIINREE